MTRGFFLDSYASAKTKWIPKKVKEEDLKSLVNFGSDLVWYSIISTW